MDARWSGVGRVGHPVAMAEPVELWWARRQWSKAREVPYPVGCYRSDWERYPVLVRQYHPDLNSGITLTQVPPAAEVYLVWQCDIGHLFVATPDEQRQRPGQSRRRSTWCPECTAGAVCRRCILAPTAHRFGSFRPSEPRGRPSREILSRGRPSRGILLLARPFSARSRRSQLRRPRGICGIGSPSYLTLISD